MSDAWGGSWSTGNSSCVDGVCGTGEWAGALPGDPGNNSTLAANAAYGGINVSWTYPALNPYAVIHTRLYRGITNNFSESVMQHIVSGSSFFDKIPKEQIRQYFYWIELVSVNSTVGAPIGPASATPLAAINETIQDLYGRIDDGFLANSLRDKIDTLDILNRDLGAEIVDRIANNEALVAALAAVQSETGEAMSYILNETTERITVDSAMIDQLNVLAVGMNDNAAAIVTERLVRIDDIESLASDVNILYTTFDENTAAILDERTARTTADGALATSLSVLAAENATLGAAIQTEQQARVSADSALSSQITTAQTVLGSNLASVQTTLQTNIDIIDGEVTNIGALYTAKVDVNGLIGGFGIYNDGSVVEAGFDVDRFWVGRTTDKVKPFIIDSVGGNTVIGMSGQVYIGTKTAEEIAFNAAEPSMNYIGAFASAPATLGLKKNSVYKNTTDKNTYVLPLADGTWTLFVPAGADAQQTYTWIAYANNASGTAGFTTGANSGQTYIGIANNKVSAVEGTTPGDYTWSLIKGDQGVPGSDGTDGVTTYTWFAYANNSTGTSGFTTGAWTNQTYIGIATNKTTAVESTTPGDYTWSLIKGDQGIPGVTTYTWIAYANNSTGSSGFTTGAWSNQTYMGIATNRTSPTESTTAGDYTWSLIKGDQGIQGPSGTNGSAGARGSMTFYASGSAWSDTTANNTVTTVTGSSTKIIGDTVTISNGSSFAGTKYWGGSSWLAPGVVIDGNLLVSGTVSASKISAGTVTANGIILSSTYGSVAFGNSSSGGIVANFLANTASQYGVHVGRGKLGVNDGFTLLGDGIMTGQLQQSGSILAGRATTDSGLITDSAYVPIQGKAFSGGHGLRGRNYGSTASGVVGANNGKAFHAESGTAGPFTGSHDVAVPIGVTLEPGTIVVDTACLIRRDWSNTFCSVATTTQANQKGVVGVYTGDLGPLSQYSILSAAYETTITDDYGNATGPLTAQYDAIKYDYNVGEINALGEGQLLVCGEGGDLEAGDLIVSSSMPGKGMRQADDIVRGYTVAKCREAVTFDSPTQVKRVACIYLCG